MILVATAAHPLSSHPRKRHGRIYCLQGVAGITNYLKPAWQWNIDTFGKRSLFRYLIQNHQPEAYRYLATEGTPRLHADLEGGKQSLELLLLDRAITVWKISNR